MTFYPEKIDVRFRAPQHSGVIEEACASGADASFSCGCVIRFSLRIDTDTDVIQAARFQTNGCGYMIAGAEFLAEKMSGKKLTDLHGLHDEVVRGWMDAEFGAIETGRETCFGACISALHNVLSDHRSRRLREWKGEIALICTCFGVSEDVIENAVICGGLATVDEVTDACAAGGGCGSCRPLIQEILDSHNREML